MMLMVLAFHTQAPDIYAPEEIYNFFTEVHVAIHALATE